MSFNCLDIESLIGFDWSGVNAYKNENKNILNYKNIEEVFFNEPLLIIEDSSHSYIKCPCVAFGKDNKNNKIIIVFIPKNKLIRIISTRKMNKKEKDFYENNKNSPHI